MNKLNSAGVAPSIFITLYKIKLRYWQPLTFCSSLLIVYAYHKASNQATNRPQKINFPSYNALL